MNNTLITKLYILWGTISWDFFFFSYWLSLYRSRKVIIAIWKCYAYLGIFFFNDKDLFIKYLLDFYTFQFIKCYHTFNFILIYIYIYIENSIVITIKINVEFSRFGILLVRDFIHFCICWTDFYIFGKVFVIWEKRILLLYLKY